MVYLSVLIMKYKNKSTKPVRSSFLLRKSELKKKSVRSLRTSFEIESVYFSDKQIKEMVAESALA